MRKSFVPFIKNSQGFSLVQVLVVLGIVGIISAGTASMMTNTVKAQRGISLNDELQNALTGVRMHMSKKDVCRANLDNIVSGKTFNDEAMDGFNTRFSRLVNPEDGNSILMADGQAVPGIPNTRVNIQLTNMRKVVDNRNYIADIVFTFDKDAGDLKNVGGPQQMTRTMSILFDTYASGATQTMTSCSVFDSNALSASDSDTLMYANCAAIGGEMINGNCDLNRKICSSVGGVFNEGSRSCSFDNLKASLCQSMSGYTWNGSSCVPPAVDVNSAKNEVKASMCASLGGSWNGSSCSTPTRGVSNITRAHCGAFTIAWADGRRETIVLNACSDGN